MVLLWTRTAIFMSRAGPIRETSLTSTRCRDIDNNPADPNYADNNTYAAHLGDRVCG